VAVGQEPACVKTCPTGAIMFGTKQAMKDQAEERIADLKERGFEKAGLYDPAGVGGTHVMYVLHHADTPSLYHGLPDEPKISPMVSVWKGITKPLAMVALGAAALGACSTSSPRAPTRCPRNWKMRWSARTRKPWRRSHSDETQSS
jgi:formate dehydrogenase iron-sulfur subunit